jgi:magnesium chelatase subunit D
MQHHSGAQRKPLAQRLTYPFSALVGQDEMKLALLLNAVSSQVAGVLVRGEKGTAKSTAVRALQALLPAITIVEDCIFGCDPADEQHMCLSCMQRLERGETLPQQQRPVRLVELPLGATEDRVLGTLDLERAIKDGVRQFEPGLLAAAHRGILYIDEVNLLPDHLVDALLDAATTGINVVEREGISFVHPAQFLLIGTMNPEEGDLRPQLLDRFGLAIEVHGLKDPQLRTQVVRRRIAFEADPAAFSEQWQGAEAELRRQIATARQLLPEVIVPDQILGMIVFLCTQMDVEGLRADITIYKAAAALAALEGRRTVTEQDVQQVAILALSHRKRRQPFEQPGLDPQEIEQLINEYHRQEKEHHTQETQGQDGHKKGTDGTVRAGLAPAQSSTQRPIDASTGNTSSSSQNEHQPPSGRPGQQDGSSAEDRAPPPQTNTDASPTPQSEQVIPPSAPTALATLTLPRMKTPIAPAQTVPSGTQMARSGTPGPQARGRIVGVRYAADHPKAIALAPTLRAAAPYQQQRRAEHTSHEQQRLWLERRDILEPIRQHKQGALILFAVDASGSMAARRRMTSAKGAVLALLQRAYQQRDHIGLLQFRGTKATLLLPPTNSTDRACKLLANLPTGGRTPLASALRLALRTFQKAQIRNKQRQAILVLVTDGRANVVDVERAPTMEGNHRDASRLPKVAISESSVGAVACPCPGSLSIPTPRQGQATAPTEKYLPLRDEARTHPHPYSPIEDAIAAAHELRAAGILSLVIDTEEGPVRMGLAAQLAQELGGSCVSLAALEAMSVANVVQVALGRRG